MKTHELFATPETVHYGYYDHRLDPVLRHLTMFPVGSRLVEEHSDRLGEHHFRFRHRRPMNLCP